MGKHEFYDQTVGHGIAMGNGFAVLHGERLDGMAGGVPKIQSLARAFFQRIGFDYATFYRNAFLE